MLVIFDGASRLGTSRLREQAEADKASEARTRAVTGKRDMALPKQGDVTRVIDAALPAASAINARCKRHQRPLQAPTTVFINGTGLWT